MAAADLGKVGEASQHTLFQRLIPRNPGGALVGNKLVFPFREDKTANA